LAKIGIVNLIWSRPLLSEPFEPFSHMPQQARVLKGSKSSVMVIKDCAKRYFLSFGAIRSVERVEMLKDDWQLETQRRKVDNCMTV